MELAEIQKHVTHFSEEIRTNATHGKEVIVGGKIESIIPPLSREDIMYVVMLDDQVGVSHIYVPNLLFHAFPEHFKIGNYIFVEGFVKVMSRSIKKEKKKDVCIYAYSLKDITNNLETS